MQEIKTGIQEIKEFKANLERQQLEFPLDADSQVVYKENLICPIDGFLVIPASIAAYDDSLIVTLNGKKYALETTSVYYV